MTTGRRPIKPGRRGKRLPATASSTLQLTQPEATDEADDEKYFAVLEQAGSAAEAAAAEITGYNTYGDLLEALDTRRKQS